MMGSKGRKLTHVQTVEHVNVDQDGVVGRSNKQIVTAFEKEPPFVKMYLEDVSRLNGLANGEKILMIELLQNMGYNNVVPSYKPVKEMIAERLGTSLGTINKMIQKLYEKGILIRKARGFYLMDPNLFGRGAWKDVSKIRTTIDYHNDGTKTVNTEVSQQLGLDLETPKKFDK